MEGEMIVKEDVEHVPAPVMLSSSGGTMRRVPSHPRINPATTSPVGSPSDGPGVTAVTAPRSSPRVPPGLGSRSPRWTKVAESVTKLSPRTTPRSPPPLGRQSSAGATATSPSKSPSSLSQRRGVPTSPPSLTRTASAEARSPPSPAVTARPATRSPERWGHAMAALERGGAPEVPEAAAPVTAAAAARRHRPRLQPRRVVAAQGFSRVASSPPKASPRKSILKPSTDREDVCIDDPAGQVVIPEVASLGQSPRGKAVPGARVARERHGGLRRNLRGDAGGPEPG